MAGSIQLFQFVQRFHQTIGIYPCQSNQKQHPINWTQAIFSICSAQSMLTTAAFLVFEAKSMFECGLVFFILITMINAIVIYLIFI